MNISAAINAKLIWLAFMRLRILDTNMGSIIIRAQAYVIILRLRITDPTCDIHSDVSIKEGGFVSEYTHMNVHE